VLHHAEVQPGDADWLVGGSMRAADGVSVGVLGPLEVVVDGRAVVLTSGRLRALLAVLAMSAGESVSVERLASAVWDEQLPANPRKAVQNYVTRLREQLGGGLVGTRPGGYVLGAAPEQVDALRFVRLLDAAAAAADPRVERGLLVKALGLWRGVPFEGVPSGWLEATEASGLVERYLAAAERRVDLDLAMGRAGELVAGLRELVARYPLRESLWVRLLVALARCGRQAEALEEYAAVRARLAEELGTDPGAELQQVYADLLAGRTPELSDTAGPPVDLRVVPRQLPLGGRDFTGRQDELAWLCKVLTGAGQHGPVVVGAIAGTGGVGKSALAIHAAHQVAEQFPDGQLYVDLHGATAGLHPLAPLEVLGRFLRALGMAPAAVPTGLEETSAAFRSWVAGRRVLVVLDNAADAAQVRPLLPASSGCGVVVTSRRALVDLDGAVHLQLEVLAPDEAVELLGRLAGRERVAAEPEAAVEVARRCGWLPLALRIAGARLAARPRWSVAALVRRLADAQGRLDELQVAETGVRASLAVSWQQLDGSDDPLDRAAAAAFGLLGVLDGPEVGVPVVARLLDQPEQAAEGVLERLVDAQLLETSRPGRYRLHDLLRLYARELARKHHHEDERAAALTRALGFYVATAWQTLPLLRPGDYRLTRADERWRKGGLELADDAAALDWLETERANLLAAVRQAAATPGGPPEIAIQLTQALFGYFWVRSHWGDWVQANQIALGVARRVGDLAAQAQADNDLGGGYWRQGRYEEALAYGQQALALRRKLGDRRAEAGSLGNLGAIRQSQGRYEEALAYLQESLTILREMGDRRGQAHSLANLGELHQRLGRYEEALACLQESLAINRDMSDRSSQAESMGSLGVVYQRQGHYEEALACLQESLAIYRELGDRRGEVQSLYDFGVVYQRQGHYEEALAHLRESLAIRRELGDAHGEAETLREIGVALRALGRSDEAQVH
jgi:DNA-binding SARP family transcriptional activator/tetratricopeptide (TPR) repeat protein